NSLAPPTVTGQAARRPAERSSQTLHRLRCGLPSDRGGPPALWPGPCECRTAGDHTHPNRSFTMFSKSSPDRPTVRRPRLGLELLEGRDTPAFLTGAEVAVGADAGGPPLVQLIDPGTGAVQTQFLAFDPSFYGGVRVAVGDVTGDGYPDLVVAAG